MQQVEDLNPEQLEEYLALQIYRYHKGIIDSYNSKCLMMALVMTIPDIAANAGKTVDNVLDDLSQIIDAESRKLIISRSLN